MELSEAAFVCVHNSCRSQVEEALGRQLASDVFENYSAGTETKSQINQDAMFCVRTFLNESIAFIPRTLGEKKHYTPKVDVEMSLDFFAKPIGIFGEFRTLTISLGKEIQGRVYLQDLCRENAVDVTEMVVKGEQKLVVDFEQIKEKGWLKNNQGDLSAPGFMISALD